MVRGLQLCRQFHVVDIALNDAAITPLNQSLVRKFAMGPPVNNPGSRESGLEEDISGRGLWQSHGAGVERLDTCGNGVTIPGRVRRWQHEPVRRRTNFCTVCGNDLVIAPETCDDGNLIDGDGCNADCGVAPLRPVRPQP